MKYSFTFPAPQDLDTVLPQAFSILHKNMSLLAPTGCPYEEDLALWLDYIRPALAEGRCRLVLMYCGQELAGYFQYSTENAIFMMDEIELRPEYQGSGIFREMYRWLEDKLPVGLSLVEAYSNKANAKSQGILEHLGLERAGENRSGSSYLYRGGFEEFWKRVV